EGTVVIAGVGGDRILEILEALDGNGYLTADRLVLSPHKDERVFVEKFSEGLGKRWRLSEPLSVRESGRERPIWVADR
ncbi:MAG: SAM-dependent methyltransferase, partial [Bdellovibrionaceae bacterium]|nr:SAM-dependent methyltransferase [Pseudobdellovibrionaceae bacterium]